MSERANLFQGVKLGDHVKRICPKCKHKADASEAFCPRCQKSMPAPVIQPSFKEAVETALYHTLAGQLSSDLQGDITEALKDLPQLAPYLKQSASIAGLDATITFGFPALFNDCDTFASVYPEIRSRLGSVRAFLADQLDLAKRSLSRLRATLPPNLLAVVFGDYAAFYQDYAQEKEKIRVEVGAGQTTSSLETMGKKLASALERVDKLVQLLGPQGPLWGLYKNFQSSESWQLVDAEWDAMLQVVGGIANFPLPIRGASK